MPKQQLGLRQECSSTWEGFSSPGWTQQQIRRVQNKQSVPTKIILAVNQIKKKKKNRESLAAAPSAQTNSCLCWESIQTQRTMRSCVWPFVLGFKGPAPHSLSLPGLDPCWHSWYNSLGVPQEGRGLWPPVTSISLWVLSHSSSRSACKPTYPWICPHGNPGLPRAV